MTVVYHHSFKELSIPNAGGWHSPVNEIISLADRAPSLLVLFFDIEVLCGLGHMGFL